MARPALLHAAIFAGALAVAAPAAAQQTPAATPDNPPPLEVGAIAPDFSLPGATRHGVLRDQINLRDYAGKTVVLAFFFRARTRG